MPIQNYSTKKTHQKVVNNISTKTKQNIVNTYNINPMCLNKNSTKSINWFSNKTNLLEHIEKHGNSDIWLSRDIAPNSGVKQFSVCEWDTYVNLLSTNNHIYEIIDKEKPRYSYLDLDYSDLAHFHAYIQTNEYIASRNYLITEVKQALQDWHESNREPFDINKVVILDSSYEKKVSLHIVNRNILFKNNTDCKIWHERFKEFIDNESVRNRKYDILTIPKCLDMAPYSSFQNFRANGQSKMISDSSDKKAITLKIISDNHSIYDTILTFVSDGDKPCEISPEWYPEIEEIDEFVFNPDIDISDILKTFLYLPPSVLEDRDSWMRVVWCAKNIGMCDEDILLISSQASNYDEQATLQIIRGHNPAGSTIGMGTVFYYLKGAIDDKLYKKLTEPYRNKQLVKQQIQLLTSTDKYKPIEKTDKYVYSEVFDENKTRCTVVCAGLGKGKTKGTVDHIIKHNYDQIIVFTSRVTFAKSVHKRLCNETEYDFTLYNKTKKGGYNIKAPYVVIQCESLHRLDIQTYTHISNNTLLIVDECESVANQMTVNKTHSINHMANLRAFEHLFRHCSKIIALDAFLSPKSIELYKDLNIDFKVYKYTVPLVKRSARHITHKAMFIEKLADDLMACKKIYLQCTSNKKLRREILPGVLELCLKRGKILKICEHHSGRNTVKLTDIETEWPSFDLVACTSTITVGVNFDKVDCFDSLYCYASSASRNIVRDVMQGLYRVRHIRDNLLTYYIDKRLFGLNLITMKSKIRKELAYSNKLKNDQATHLLQSGYEETPAWVTNLIVNNRYEQNMSCMNIEPMFEYYLEQCQYSQEIDVIHADADEVTTPEEVKIEYDDIPEIDYSEVKALKSRKINGDNLTEIEVASITKFWFLYTLIPNCKTQAMAWMYYNDYGFTKFSNIGYEKGIHDGSVRIRDLIEDNKFSGVVNSITLQLKWIGEICEQLGLKNSYELRVPVTKEKLEQVAPWFVENSYDLHTVFGMRDFSKKPKKEPTLVRKTTDLINKILLKWGYSKMEKDNNKTFSKRDENGKRDDLTGYSIVSQNYRVEKDGMFKFIDDRYPTDIIKAKSKQRFDRLVTTSRSVKADLILREK